MPMKRKRYAVILGLVALTGFCLWQGQDSARQSTTATRSTSDGIQPAKTQPAMLVRSLDFVVNDVAALLVEPDTMRRDEKVQGLIASIEFNEIPVVLQFLQRQEQTEVLQDLQ